MVRKRDRFWEYAEQLDGKFKCKFCEKTFAGGVSRVKSHLSRIKGGGIDICTEVHEDVRVAAADVIAGPNKKAKTEAGSGKTEETLPKMLMSKDGVMLDKLLAKFILLNDVDVDIVRRPSFIDFVNAVAEHGSHYKVPCCSLVKTKLVPDLEKEIGEHVENVKKSWDKTGCTLMSDIWCDEEISFVKIFAYSIEGMVLLRTLTIDKTELTGTLPQGISYFVTQNMGTNSIVQYITKSGQKEIFYEDMPIGNCARAYETNCISHQIHLLFKDIYNEIKWVRKAFDQARAVVTKTHKHDGISSSMKQFTSNWESKRSSTTNFYSNYYMLQLIMENESHLRLLVSSSEWLSLGFEKDESGVEAGEIIRSSEFWIEGKEVLHALEPIFQVLYLVDCHEATSGFLYGAVEMADEAMRQIYETNVPKYQSLWEMFKPWKSDIIHPIHAAAAFLNPAFMCSEKFTESNAMKRGMNIMLDKVVRGEEKEKFVQEMLLYRKKEPKLFTSIGMTMLGTSHPRDWWDYCGDVLPVLKKYAIQILSQPCSTSFCRQGLSAFETAQSEKRNPLMPAVRDDSLYLRTNALLMENFNTMKEKIKKPLNLEKLGELPDFAEFIKEDFTRDLLDEAKVPLSDGHCEGIRVHEGTSNAFTVEDANTGEIRTGSSVEPSSTEVTQQQWLSSRPHCQSGSASPVVRSSGDAQEAACSKIKDAASTRDVHWSGHTADATDANAAVAFDAAADLADLAADLAAVVFDAATDLAADLADLAADLATLTAHLAPPALPPTSPPPSTWPTRPSPMPSTRLPPPLITL